MQINNGKKFNKDLDTNNNKIINKNKNLQCRYTNVDFIHDVANL